MNFSLWLYRRSTNIKIVKPRIIIPKGELSKDFTSTIARYAHICYAVEESPRSNVDLIRGLIRSGHESVLEHEKITVIWECDRAIANELVRHRIASFTQESTRYVKYDDIPVIAPFGLNDEEFAAWKIGAEDSEGAYDRMIVMGVRPQIARGVLCNSLRTRIVITANLREWRHILTLRCAKDAHPQMQQMAIPTLVEFTKAYGVFFETVPYNKDFAVEDYAEVVYE